MVHTDDHSSEGVGGAAIINTDSKLSTSAREASSADFRRFASAGGLDSRFSQLPAVVEFARALVQRRSFFVGALRREMSKVLLARSSPGTAPEDNRPDGNDVEAMVTANPWVFQAGALELPEGSHRLRPDVMLWWHSKFCINCTWDAQPDSCRLNPRCYFASMLRCIERGWQPPFYREPWVPPYEVKGNYRTTDQFREGVEGELLGSMLANRAIMPCAPSDTQIVHPVGAVVKSSDKMRAKALLNLSVTDQSTLTAANNQLIGMGLPKIKVRVTMDCTATGANAATMPARFMYPGLRSGIDMVVQGSVLGVSDVSRYFHSFPWSYDMRDRMRVEWRGQLYECWGLSFGFSLCPYYCSAWSAEFRIWVQRAIGECAHMVDDWLLQGIDLAEVQRRCQKLAEMFESIGLGMAMEKNKYGTSVKFLGVVIDTIAMRLRIDGLQALGTRLLLQEVRIKLLKRQRVGHGTWYHLAGKLNWFAEVAQSGRLHTHSLWEHLRASDELKGPQAVRDRLLRDIDWWIRLLNSWEGDKEGGGEYRILSASEVLAKPDLLHIIQSDAAGEDGIGYVHGCYHDGAERKYGSMTWGAATPPSSSHAMELRALRCCLENAGIPRRPLVLLWITDSTSAALSVNKGNCQSPEGYDELEFIFGLCDAYGYELVAMWAPREENVLADYLSHLSALLCRPSIHGRVGALASPPRSSKSCGAEDGMVQADRVY